MDLLETSMAQRGLFSEVKAYKADNDKTHDPHQTMKYAKGSNKSMPSAQVATDIVDAPPTPNTLYRCTNFRLKVMPC